MSDNSQKGEAKKEFNVVIAMEEGEPLGAVPNDKMVIVKIQAGTLAEGKLKVGDTILRVNNRIINDQHHFFQLLRYAPPEATLLVFRDENKAAELQSRIHIPHERERNITRRDGYSYEMVTLVWKQGGPKLGLGIKHFQNRVLVSKTDAGSISAECLKIGDHIVDLDGTPVTDKDVCRQMLVKALQTNGKVTMVVERPETMEAKFWAKKALEVQIALPPSVQMNSDVLEILNKQKAKLKDVKPPAKGILKGGKIDKPVKVHDQLGSHVIASDNEGKFLRAVKK